MLSGSLDGEGGRREEGEFEEEASYQEARRRGLLQRLEALLRGSEASLSAQDLLAEAKAVVADLGVELHGQAVQWRESYSRVYREVESLTKQLEITQKEAGEHVEQARLEAESKQKELSTRVALLREELVSKVRELLPRKSNAVP